jgi:serine/threonine protein kinase
MAVFSQARRQLKKEDVVDIAKQIAAAMVVIHGEGIVHCDLKTANIMVQPTKLIKIVGFGMAGEISDKQHMAKRGGTIE